MNCRIEGTNFCETISKRSISICLPVCPPGFFLSQGCIVLAECLGRKERCNTGRMRKQESGWVQKNRKQGEAVIRWPLWCTLGFLVLWVIVSCLLNYRKFGAIKSVDEFKSSLEGWWEGPALCTPPGIAECWIWWRGKTADGFNAMFLMPTASNAHRGKKLRRFAMQCKCMCRKN